jgi:putative hydrolase of the HAD superfamily
MKLIVFDLDDTLFPESEFVLSGFHSVSRWISAQYSIFDFDEVAVSLFSEGHRGDIFNKALDAIGLKYDSQLLQELVNIYRNHKPALCLYEDARWAINHYCDSGVSIITDGYLEAQRNKVQALELESYVSNIIYTDFYGRENWKPSPLPYEMMMKLTHREAHDCIYIGDNPNKDFVTAKKMGWFTVRIRRSHGENIHVLQNEKYEADVTISSLFDLPQVL